jgi:hypothetical protein|tara:strand:+ start:978 stop:1088 length:111 start_codon:yes stop_codon:yes gene_type:complete
MEKVSIHAAAAEPGSQAVKWLFGECFREKEQPEIPY